jgi:hypothetical protein
VAPRPGDKLVGAWVPAPFADSVDALAGVTQLSRAELVRLALADVALRLANGSDGRATPNG